MSEISQNVQGRLVVVWLSWFIGGICGVVILLVIICYCRLMPRHQKSLDEQYLKEAYATKYAQSYSQDGGYRVKQAEVQRHNRPVSYGGGASGKCSVDPEEGTRRLGSGHEARNNTVQYASSSMLDEVDGDGSLSAMKTRSLPAFLRPKPRPLSTEDDLQQLYAKVSLSKKYKNRMRSEHAAIIALSKSHSQYLDGDAVIVYDQRTAL